MTTYLARFGDAEGLLTAAAVISTTLLAVTFAVDRVLQRRVLLSDTIWAAVLALLLLAPTATVLLPSSVAARLMSYVPLRASVGDGVGPRQFERARPQSHDGARKRFERGRPMEAVSQAQNFESTGPQTNGFSYVVLLAIIAAFGTSVLAGRLVISYSLCRRLSRNALTCESRLWRDRLERHTATFGMRRHVSLKVSAHITTPISIHWLRPVIIVPLKLATTSCTATVDSVLLHELTHVVRNDYLRQIGWKVCECLYWWNPLIWLATRRVSVVREVVCDGFCASQLQNRQSYIDSLFDVARLLIEERRQLLVVPMARSSQLENRLVSLNNVRISAYRSRRPVRWSVTSAALLLALIVGAVSSGGEQNKELNDGKATSTAANEKGKNDTAPSYSSSTLAANPSEAQKKAAEEGRKRIVELTGQLSKEPEFQLAAPVTLRHVPAGSSSKALRELRQLLGDDGHIASMEIQAVDGDVRIAEWNSRDDRTVADVLRDVVGVRLQQLNFNKDFDRDAFLNTPFPGDWVSSHDPTLQRPLDQNELSVVAKAIPDKEGSLYRIFLTQTYTPVYVATGDYRFRALPDGVGHASALSKKVAQIADGEFWIPARRLRYTGSVVRGFDNFLGAWAEVLLTPIIDQVSTRPIKDDYFVRYPDKSKVKFTAPLAPDVEQEVLQRFSEQTGLTLTKSQRRVPVVRVEKIKSL